MGKEKKLVASARTQLSDDWRVQAREPGYRMERLNALAFPKGENPMCELTGQTATVQMITPFVNLYYASRADAEQSWAGIMHKLCPLLGPLRSKAPIVGSEEERERRQKTLEVSLRALVELTKNEAARFLAEKRYELAIPGALQSLKFSERVFGRGSVELVPSYLLLAEANLGLRRLAAAEEQLSLANFSILKNPECANTIRSQLHRNFGKLCALQGKNEEALRHVAHDVYYSSLDFGPEHVDTAVGYFHMANIFFTDGRVEQGLAFYDKVVDIWYKFLATLRDRSDVDVLNAAQTAEARLTLERILATRQQYLGDKHIAVGEAKYTLGLLHLFLGGHADALQMVGQAMLVYEDQLGAEHPSTVDVKAVMDQLRASAARDDGGTDA
jgi:tetratricopeptide (TPR) repeat protein